jgi:hypothetical protein
MFLNAEAEFASSEHPVHAAVAEHKRLVERDVEALAREAGARDPGDLAAALCLLMEGAVVLAPIRGRADVIRAGRAAARTIIESALEPEGS